jgi:hypothetical protein
VSCGALHQCGREDGRACAPPERSAGAIRCRPLPRHPQCHTSHPATPCQSVRRTVRDDQFMANSPVRFGHAVRCCSVVYPVALCSLRAHRAERTTAGLENRPAIAHSCWSGVSSRSAQGFLPLSTVSFTAIPVSFSSPWALLFTRSFSARVSRAAFLPVLLMSRATLFSPPGCSLFEP